MEIGDNTTIYDPTNTLIDETRPWMISIGENVKITYGTIILTHGYDWSVLRNVYGDVLGSSGGVRIEDNVFIGMRTTILKGVHIGKNVIIGANSLVNKDIPDNCVAAGNPCRVIMTIEEYYKKRKELQIQEARELVRQYRNIYGTEVSKTGLHEFFWIFTDSTDRLPKEWENVNNLCGNIAKTKDAFKKHEKIYDSLETFLKSIK